MKMFQNCGEIAAQVELYCDFDTSVLAAIVPFKDAGFALHWLHAKDKRPIGENWSEASVASINHLQRTHQPGYNLGVRPGEPSLLASGQYLHIFDLDIRVPDLADEAWAAFSDLFPGVVVTDFPSVISGSGGESRHIYFATDKPFFGKKLAVSEGKHRHFSKKLGRETWSYDWEIDLFGTGRQVAMPPSIHPETGLAYRWEREFDLDGLEFGGAPSIPAHAIENIGAVQTATFAFEEREPLTFEPGQLERDLEVLPINRWDNRDDWVLIGQALHHQFGGSDEGFELWMKYSAQSKQFLVGSTRAKELRRYRQFGRNRRQPVTMGTVRQWAQEARTARFADRLDELDDLDDEDSDFDALLGTSPTDADDIDAIFGKDLDESLPWTSLLAVTKDGDGIAANLHNIRLIVENDVWTKEVMAYNEFTQDVVQRGLPGKKSPRRKNAAKPVLQLDGQSWSLHDRINGDFWTEDKDNAIRALIEAPTTMGGYGLKVPDRDLRAAIDIAARKNSFHPVREYLQSMAWDKKPRVDRLFIDYVGAPDDAYHRAVARIMMVAAVTRIFEPGHKFDTAVILEGVQGKRKSTFISSLAKSWFTEVDCDITDTQAMVENLQGAWIAELNELGGFAKADIRHIKAFISRRSDKVRLAYAKRAKEYHRQGILIGSTNDSVYLKDPTGGRRFLPVRCQISGEIDTDRLMGEIDQMWGEAYQLYLQMRKNQPRGMLPLYLSEDEARTIAEQLQESRQVESSEDALAGRIEEWLNKPMVSGDLGDPKEGMFRNEVCLMQVWCECLGRDEAQYIGMWPSTLGRAMRMVKGWGETTRRPRFGRFGQQRAFERNGWMADSVNPKGNWHELAVA